MASPTASHDKSLEEKGKGNVNLKTKLEAKKVVMHVSLASFIASHDKSLKEKGKGNVNLKRKRKGKKPSPVALASRIASHYKSLKEEGKGNVKPRMSVSDHVACDNPRRYIHSYKCPCSVHSGAAAFTPFLGIVDQIRQLFPNSLVEPPVEKPTSLKMPKPPAPTIKF